MLLSSCFSACHSLSLPPPTSPLAIALFIYFFPLSFCSPPRVPSSFLSPAAPAVLACIRSPLSRPSILPQPFSALLPLSFSTCIDLRFPLYRLILHSLLLFLDCCNAPLALASVCLAHFSPVFPSLIRPPIAIALQLSIPWPLYFSLSTAYTLNAIATVTTSLLSASYSLAT